MGERWSSELGCAVPLLALICYCRLIAHMTKLVSFQMYWKFTFFDGADSVLVAKNVKICHNKCIWKGLRLILEIQRKWKVTEDIMRHVTCRESLLNLAWHLGADDAFLLLIPHTCQTVSKIYWKLYVTFVGGTSWILWLKYSATMGSFVSFHWSV